jgi:hypothetical protein
MELPENQNNFPSKVMDYLATGKPILSTRFAGWEKFREYITFCEAGELAAEMHSMQQEIQKVSMRADYDRNRKAAEGYLWENQVKRVLGSED